MSKLNRQLKILNPVKMIEIVNLKSQPIIRFINLIEGVKIQFHI